MAKVIEIAISQNFKEQMKNVNEIETVKGKGILNDRYFKHNNHKKCQVTLIEIENISFYNQISCTNILPKDFRRNLITKGIKLNELVGFEFFIGEVKVKAHDLCRPCKNLQETLKQKDLVKEFLKKGGLRCEVLKSGKVSVGDKIEF